MPSDNAEIMGPLQEMLTEMHHELTRITFYNDFESGHIDVDSIILLYTEFYHYISQTKRTLDTEIVTMEKIYKNEDDPLLRSLPQLWRDIRDSQRINPEKGHEHLLLSDLRALDFMGPICDPWPMVEKYIATAQKIAQTEPVATLGEMFLLEGITPYVEGKWANIVKNSGIPNIHNAVSFMKTEAQSGIEHEDFKIKLIKELEHAKYAERHKRQIISRARFVKDEFYIPMWKRFDEEEHHHVI